MKYNPIKIFSVVAILWVSVALLWDWQGGILAWIIANLAIYVTVGALLSVVAYILYKIGAWLVK